MAAVTRETQEKQPRNGQSRNTSVPRINEEYITQVSEEIESRVSKKLSQEFSRTESHILGALCKLDEILLNPQIRTHSGTVLGFFWNPNVGNQGTNENDSQSDPNPEASIFRSQTSQNSGPEFGHDMMTRVQKQSLCGHYMLTKVQKECLCGHGMVKDQIRNCPHVVTGIQEDVPYCSLVTSSGKQKKARSACQPPFRSENTRATIEADQILLALQQLESNSNSPTRTTTLTKFQNCLNPSRQQCPPSMEQQRKLNCLKIYSKRV